MMRRIAVIALITALLVGMMPATAFAWCNGPAKSGQPGNGYGTHDWLLDRAIRIAGADGAWVWRTTALLATDDPDSQSTLAYYHWYKESGACRGAPFIVSELYHNAVVALRSGDRVAASKYLGVLSHYYADITQPFHTTDASAPYRYLHVRYEYKVDDYTNTRYASQAWVTPRPTVAVNDIRSKTMDTAIYIRSLYPGLFASYRASNSVRSGTSGRVTRIALSRAANDLADIIRTIPTGAGEATSVATVNMRLNTTSPRRDQKVGATVTVADADGNPVNGVSVKFVWRLPGGAVTWQTFTGRDGHVSRYQPISSVPIGRATEVVAYVTSNGVVTTPMCTFTPVR